MPAFIVSYDLNQQGQNYDCIIQKLEELDAWRMQQSVWILSVESTSSAIRDTLQPCLDSNDTLFVGRLSSGAWKGLSAEATAWLRSVI